MFKQYRVPVGNDVFCAVQNVLGGSFAYCKSRNPLTIIMHACSSNMSKGAVIINQSQVSGLPRSLPNADQCRSKSWHLSKMSLNADHCRSMPINS